VIVEFMRNNVDELVFINTEHIVSLTIRRANGPDEKTEVSVTLINGKVLTSIEDYQPDGDLGPMTYRLLAKLAPQEYTERFLNVQTRRAQQGTERS
jgi:hypothetical protein